MKIRLLLAFAIVSISCQTRPEPILLNRDQCAFCKMPVADLQFACEAITQKGRVYKFDDLHCLFGFTKAEEMMDGRYFVSAANSPSSLISVQQAFFVKSGSIKSPMGGSTLAFSEKQAAALAARSYNTNVSLWDDVKN